MANRAMNAKLERARRQGRELAAAEYSKPFYAGHSTIGAAEARRDELARLVAEYTANKGTITRCPDGKRPAERRRGGVVLGTATEGRAALLPGVAQRAGRHFHINMASRLIPAK